MDQYRERRTVLLRALLSLACGGLAAGTCLLRGLPGLDVALWSVLVPILVGGLLTLVRQAFWRARAGRRHRAQVVVPDAVAQACAALLEAKEQGAPLEELLALARELHEAELGLARKTAARGGAVPQALGDELLLRDRPATVPSQS